MPDLPGMLPGDAQPLALGTGEPPGGDAELGARLGLLATRQVESLGLTEVAQKIVTSEALTERDLRLLADASLPLVGKLVELAGHRAPPLEPPPAQYVIACPLGSLLETRDLEVAVEEAAVVVAEQLDSAGNEERCLVAVDRWTGHVGPREMLIALRRVLESVAGRLVPLGPSSHDIRVWLGDAAVAGGQQELPMLLGALRSARIDTIVGGDDLDIHRAAAEADFQVIVGQPICEPADLCRRLIEARRRLADTGRFVAWQPELTMGLDAATLSPSDPTGLEVMQAVALARLALPARVAIRAPWAKLGAKTAHAAMFFGASHWGLMAANPLAAEILNLPTTADWAELLEGNASTAAHDPETSKVI